MAVQPGFKILLPQTITVCIHGASDAGKSSLASCAPDLDPSEPLFVEDALFIDAEGGTISLPTRGAGIIVERFPADPLQLVQTEQNLADAVEYVKANRARFRYAAFDSLDRFQEQALADMVKRKKHERPEMQDWGDILYLLQKFARTLPTWGVNVICTCHTTEGTDENDRLKKKMPLMQGSFQSRLASYFDVVGYYEKTIDDAGHEQRILHTKGTNKFYARSRLGSCLPDTIVNPTIPGILKTYHQRRSELIEKLRTDPRVQIIETREV